MDTLGTLLYHTCPHTLAVEEDASQFQPVRNRWNELLGFALLGRQHQKQLQSANPAPAPPALPTQRINEQKAHTYLFLTSRNCSPAERTSWTQTTLTTEPNQTNQPTILPRLQLALDLMERNKRRCVSKVSYATKTVQAGACHVYCRHTKYVHHRWNGMS